MCFIQKGWLKAKHTQSKTGRVTQLAEADKDNVGGKEKPGPS